MALDTDLPDKIELKIADECYLDNYDNYRDSGDCSHLYWLNLHPRAKCHPYGILLSKEFEDICLNYMWDFLNNYEFIEDLGDGFFTEERSLLDLVSSLDNHLNRLILRLIYQSKNN